MQRQPQVEMETMSDCKEAIKEKRTKSQVKAV